MQKAPKETTTAIAKLSQKYGMEEAKLIDTLRATVIKSKKIKGRDGKPDTWVPASIEEVNAGLMVAAQYDLDPLLKQIHFFPAEGGGIVPIVGYDGWVKLTNREKRFAGFRSIDNVDSGNNLVSCTGIMKIFNSPDGNAGYGTYEVSVTEYLEECRRDTEPWKKWPRRMLRNKTYIQTARMAFGISGIYDEDEGERILEGQEIDVTPVKVPQALPKSPSSTTSGAPKTQNSEKTGGSISHEDAAGSTISGSAPSHASGGGDQGGAGQPPAAAGEVKDAPKTDAQKKEYILLVAGKAAEKFGVSVEQVIYDLSKFTSTNKETKKEEEVGVQGINDPRLTPRWLAKTYGEAKKLEAQLDGPF